MILNDGTDLSKFKINKHRILIRIRATDRENIFLSKEIKREDGSSVRLIKTVDVKSDMDRKSTLFCRLGEVIDVGDNVKEIKKGDTAILDYKLDNDDTVLVGWVREDKIIAPVGLTTYIEQDKIHYANRLNPKDIVVAKRGEIESISDVIGYIRNGEYYAIDPYVLLKIKPTHLQKETKSGIIYNDYQTYIETKVLAVSNISREKYSILKRSEIKVLEKDTFEIDLGKEKILACNDNDILQIKITSDEEEIVFD